MNFYEFQYPYYALIKAKDKEGAVKHYIEAVAGGDEEFDELLEEAQQVKDYYAIAKFSRVVDEEGKELIEFDEIIEVVESDRTELLMIDSALI